MNGNLHEKQQEEVERIAREKVARSRRELIEHLQSLLQKGHKQADGIDRALLTLSAGALLLSITFIGTLSETKRWLVLLFSGWGCFIVSIIMMIFAMSKAQYQSHKDAVETAANLERFSQMSLPEAADLQVIFRSEQIGVSRG